MSEALHKAITPSSSGTEALRTRFVSREGSPVQVIGASGR